METIFAPICPLGGSVVSIRFSGDNVFDLFDFFKISKEIYLNKSLFFTKLHYKNKILDEVIVKVFKKPNSFTGEDVIEIDLHASRLILKDFLNIVSKIPNFRFATNGEFSKRAFLNGKINLIKTEGINAIIRAETEQQRKIANEMFFGNINSKYKNIRQQLINAMSFVETQIDFAEEEVPDDVIEDIKQITNNLIKEMNICLEDKKAIDKINQGISIAIIGNPNVGKSSLLNWLAKREIAIVSPIAGTTRDVLSVDIDLDGYKTTFFDTAGIRESEDLIEKEGIKRAKNIAKDADLCIFICDKIEDCDKIINESKTYNNDVIFVLNKTDLIDEKMIKNEFKKNNVISISVLKQENLDELLNIIKQKVLEKVELKQNPLVVNERQEILLKQCVEVLSSIDFDTMQIEIIGENIRIAIDKISEIIGQIYTDDILDNIFSKFCIGK